MELEDSSDRDIFSGGAVRDTAAGKPRFDLISPYFYELIQDSTILDGVFRNHRSLDLLLVYEKIRINPTHRFSWIRLLGLLTARQPAAIRTSGIQTFIEHELQAGLVAGAKKYTERNWERGIPTSRSFASLSRHIRQLINNESQEDHYRAALCNIMFIWHNQRMVEEGRMAPQFADWGGYPRHILIEPDGVPICVARFRHRLDSAQCNPGVAHLLLRSLVLPPGCSRTTAIVYISGPMRGYPHFNFSAFDAAKERFLGRGYAVLSPADIDRQAGEPEPGVDVANKTAAPLRDYIYRDFYAVYALSPEDSDVIAMLPKWWASLGAAAEFHMAKWLGLSVLDAQTGKTLQY